MKAHRSEMRFSWAQMGGNTVNGHRIASGTMAPFNGASFFGVFCAFAFFEGEVGTVGQLSGKGGRISSRCGAFC